MSIAMSQLGARAFNHEPSADTEQEYDRLRDAARREHELRGNCFDRSRQAYESGDGARAKQLSEEGKEHGRKMDEYNKQASDYIFRANNAVDRVAGDTIDLHGQYVEEAERILEQRIAAGKQRGEQGLHVIVGKGNHSKDHVRKIEPMVERVCNEQGLKWNTEANAGRMYINLQGGEAPPPSQAPGGGWPGHNQPSGGQPHGQPHGQPQHGGQQQGGQQGGDEVEQALKLIPKLLKKFGCCTVM